MATIYISIILLFRVVQAIFNKRSSNQVKSIPMLVGYTSFKMAISAFLALFLIIVSGNGFKIDFLTFLIGTFSGVTLFLATFFSIYSMKSGTVSLSSMFGTAGMLVPLFAGIFLFNQPIRAMQWVGVAIFFVSAFLLAKSSKQTYSNFSFKTIFLLIGSMLANGGTMLAQQFFTAYVPDGDVSVFSFISFGVLALLGAIVFIILYFKNKNCKSPTEIKLSKSLVICGIALAIAVFVINQLATISTALVAPVILFTFINGGGTVISTVVAALMYKEKLSLYTVLGVIIGIVSLIIIKIF